MKYSVIAATFSGNKGAASMLESSIQSISSKDSNAEFFVFTVYPDQDKKFNNYDNVKILNAKPLYLGLVINSFAMLHRLLPPLRRLIEKNREIKALYESDYLLDEGGITFVDGRTKFLIYNVATILPGILLKKKVVKCSQAMGPFSGINKLIAKSILPRVSIIFARGSRTEEHLKSLNLENFKLSTDLAFLLKIQSSQKKIAQKKLRDTIKINKADKLITIMPSEVVRKRTENSGISYEIYNVKLIESCLKKGFKVLLLAYSARGNTHKHHNNDLVVCRKIAKEINNVNFAFIDEELNAQQIRVIIGHSHLVVTSRFHAMIASICMNVPPVVIGWSHKYKEIMKNFGLENYALDSRELDLNRTIKLIDQTDNNLVNLTKSISKKLPDAKKDAEKQIKWILEN